MNPSPEPAAQCSRSSRSRDPTTFPDTDLGQTTPRGGLPPDRHRRRGTDFVSGLLWIGTPRNVRGCAARPSGTQSTTLESLWGLPCTHRQPARSAHPALPSVCGAAPAATAATAAIWVVASRRHLPGVRAQLPGLRRRRRRGPGRGCAPGWATCASSAWTPSGSARSTPRRSTTTATTWPTTWA